MQVWESKRVKRRIKQKPDFIFDFIFILRALRSSSWFPHLHNRKWTEIFCMIFYLGKLVSFNCPLRLQTDQFEQNGSLCSLTDWFNWLNYLFTRPNNAKKKGKKNAEYLVWAPSSNAVNNFRFDIFLKQVLQCCVTLRYFFTFITIRYLRALKHCQKIFHIHENIRVTKYLNKSSNDIAFLDLIYRAFILSLFKRVQASFCLPRNHCNNLLSRPQNT